MQIKEFGKEHSKIILMIHPNCVWWEVFDYVIPVLSENYHLIIPALPGHDPENPHCDYTSVEQIAQETEDWLLTHGYGTVECLYGCSMGGAVVTRLAVNHRLNPRHIVIDAGMTPYQLPKWLTYLIGIRDWLVVEMGKHGSIQVLRGMFSPDKYSDEDIKYIKKVLKSISSRTIWRSFYSCNNYSMPEEIKQPACPMQYWYGEEEKKARKADIAYMKKIFPQIQLVENPGMGHGEFFTLYPQAFCSQLTTFIEKNVIEHKGG